MASSNRFLLPVILLCFLSLFQAQETRRKTRVIDIPRMTTGGALPEAARLGKYFFLDEASGDLILVYPTDLSEENFRAPSDKVLVTERVRLAIGVRPTVETLITADVRFSYEYRVGNEAQATQQIGKWVLEPPSLGDHIRSMKGPTGWGFNTWELPNEREENRLSVMNLVPEARLITALDLVRKQIKWWYRGLGGASLEPGTCCVSFFVNSRNLPGIVTAYFQGTSYKPSTSPAVPRPLSDLVPAFNFIETNSVSMPVIGPKFEPTTLVEARLCDVISDVEALVREQRLQATPFMGGLLALSPGCLQRGAAGLALGVKKLTGQAEDPFEREILQALEINLAFP